MHIKPRWKKVFADLLGNKSRTVLVVLSIAIGVFAVGMVANAYLVLDEASTVGYQAVNPTSAFIVSSPFDDELVDLIMLVGESLVKARGRVIYVEELPDGTFHAGIVFQEISQHGQESLRKYLSDIMIHGVQRRGILRKID